MHYIARNIIIASELNYLDIHSFPMEIVAVTVADGGETMDGSEGNGCI